MDLSWFSVALKAHTKHQSSAKKAITYTTMLRTTARRGLFSRCSTLATREFNLETTSIPWRSASAFIPFHSEHTDAITSLKQDHRKVDHMLTQLIELTKIPIKDKEAAKPLEQRKLLEDIIKELSVHSHIEELHVYPVIRAKVSDGNKVIDHSLSEHLEVKQILYDLDQFSGSLGTNPEYWPQFPVLKIEALHKSLSQHVKEEEEQIFPAFSKTMTKEGLVQLGGVLETARGQVPTRPHPSAPNAPPFMSMVAPAAAAMDKAKDMYRHAQDQMSGAADATRSPPPA